MMMVLTPMATSEVSAAEYSTYDIDGYNKISILTISSNTATCKSRFLGATDVSKVTVQQSLQKKNWLIWSNVCSWSTTINGKTAICTNTKSGLSSGTYRVKSVFTVTLSNGETESAIVYSDTKTI